ncbi:MAG: glycoside hydrolase family 3 N-terminal domain-containing protein [Longimicrobiales bacterium]|nr:glycoside hydrolase family 3 N-terminal domain-containing protein [Longimicrobiales bacterium]
MIGRRAARVATALAALLAAGALPAGPAAVTPIAPVPASAQERGSIYHEGWIDLNKNGRLDPYEDPGRPIPERVEDLLARMTLEEKTMQTVTLYGYGRVLRDPLPRPEWREALWKDGLGNIDEQHNGVVETELAYPWPEHARALNAVQRWFVEETRLGIPVDFTNEGIRGLAHHKATSFPAQIAQASTWDPELIEAIGRITGREARALGYTNIYSPILDLARDPRWGRTVETYGEDPFLVATLGEAAVRGLQSQRVASTPKHFAVYGVPEGGRDGDARTAPHVASRDLHELHLYPFRRAFAAGALGTMSSYNDWNGLPVTGSRYFLTELLRDTYGFEGYVVSDSRAVEDLVDKHRVAVDRKDAVRQAIEAGLNVRTDFSDPGLWVLPLRELVREGTVATETLDDRVRDVIRVKLRLGLFDRPYVEDPDATERTVRSDDALAMSLRAARASLVLLKNDGTLPLDRGALRSILVTGPMAAATEYAESRYGANHLDVTSVLDGLRTHVGAEVEVRYERGVAETDDDWPHSELFDDPPPDSVLAGIEAAVAQARSVDVVVAVMGGGNAVVGESRSRTSLDLPGHQRALLRALHATGTPLVVVLVNGRPLTVNWADRHAAAILEAWFPTEASGRVIAEALFGDIEPGGRLPITFPRTVGQIPLAFPHKRASWAPEADWVGVDTRVNGPLYPFGHGLTYTTFEYGDLRVEPARAAPMDTVTVSFRVTNTGNRPGDAVPQLYVRDVVATVTTWDMRLRGFQRIRLEPGQSRTVTLRLGPEDLWILDRAMQWTVEAGTFEVMVGASSADLRLRGSFEVTETARFGAVPTPVAER